MNFEKKTVLYTRNSKYREEYFKTHKGFFGLGIYCCSYCGKFMSKEKTTVDHLIPVDAAKKSCIVRFMFRNKEDGINNHKNLVAACKRCNSKKGNRGRIWIIQGFIGQVFWYIFWVLLVLTIVTVFLLNAVGLISIPEIINSIKYALMPRNIFY